MAFRLQYIGTRFQSHFLKRGGGGRKWKGKGKRWRKRKIGRKRRKEKWVRTIGDDMGRMRRVSMRHGR